ncbi:2-phosphoxylose phosphatase 1 [Aplysia californica]|uniref:2-phosphoxylose phosphatase 1 n=1 Tax=Aplysia californica TaxID=6500 RepID=A0ABM0JYB3_APLCA|nr:2-phosphoxylose phosphatase 1 [Aplysia californica]
MRTIRCDRLLHLKSLLIIGVFSLLLTFLILTYSSSDMHHSNEDAFSHGEPGVFRMSQKKVIKEKVKGKKSKVVDEEETPVFHKDTRPPLMVKRMSEYCNLPHDMSVAQQGLAPKDYQLLNVHTVIRHGDRSPIFRLPGLDRSDLSCLLDADQYLHLPKVASFAHVLAASSDQLPRDSTFNRWALYPSHKICGEGQLTGQGAVQHIMNGMLYSERYMHQHRLFDESNWEQRYLVHTTEVSRTFQSAIAFSYGLLPQFDLKRLNLFRSGSLEFCEDRVFHGACRCPGLEMFRSQAERECKMSAADTKLYTALKKHVDEVLHLRGQNIPGPSSLMDGLSHLACHSIPLPCNSNGTCITAKAYETVWRLIDAKTKCLGQNLKYKKFAKALMHGLLFRISREFSIAIQNGSNPTFHLYSGHDTTVTPLITALELSNNVWPRFATTITFELFKKQSKGDHYIRILKNGQLVTSEAIFCRGRTDENGMCAFSHFSNYVASQKLKEFCDSLKPVMKKFF